MVNVGQRFEPGGVLPDGFTFPEGSKVYNLRDIVFVSYYVERGPNFNRLMANYRGDGPAVIAENIEDFQVRYSPTAGGTCNAPPSGDVPWVCLSLDSLSSFKSEVAGQGDGGYSRVKLTKDVSIRN
jgi:hypothetical protein